MKFKQSVGLIVVAGLVVAACSGSSSSSNGGGGAAEPAPQGQAVMNGPPIDLPITRADVPSSGRCRVFVIDFGRIASSNDFGCNNIENSVQLGSFIMFRSRSNRNDVYLCRMSQSEQGVIDGIDVYDYSRLRLTRVVLPRQRRTMDNTMKCIDAEGR
ncbi:MAG: hypothetical protein V3T56_08275 [Gemmatimonadales bacterium]